MKLVSGLALSSCVFVGALAAGCANGGDTNGASTSSNTDTTNSVKSASGTKPSAAGGKHLKLAFVTNNPSDYWTLARKGTEKAKKELTPNVEVDFQMPAQGTADAQQRIVDNLLVQGVDGIAISPVDAVNEKALLNKAAAKTLVICQDSDATASNRAFYVGTDNVAAGKLAGEALKKALPNGGKILAFVGKLDAQNAKDRLQGVKDAIQGTKIELLDTLTDDANHTKAKTNAVTSLIRNPDLAGMVGLWSYNGPAILSAVKGAGKVGKVQIVCFDEELDTIAGIKSGAIAATIVQQPYNFGYQAIMDMNKYLNGDKSFVPVGKQIFVPARTITKDNITAFSTEMDKLRKS